MTNYAHGHTAEEAAAQYLERHGYEILDRNWRTRACEIDIVAKKAKTISFVEVKYRQNAAQGDGLDYITIAKLKQMQFAAEMWMTRHDWKGDITLAAIEVSGTDYSVSEFIETID